MKVKAKDVVSFQQDGMTISGPLFDRLQDIVGESGWASVLGMLAGIATQEGQEQLGYSIDKAKKRYSRTKDL